MMQQCRVLCNDMICMIMMCRRSAAEFERSRINNRLPSALQTSTDGAVILFLWIKARALFTTSDLLVVINLKQEEAVDCEL